jgi:two-component system, chemotaxis family, CheB/CheR fusion protein
LSESETQPRPSEAASKSARSQFPFPVIGIGASAGGVEAVSALLQHLPADTGAALVIVLHLDPDRESHLAQVLGSRTSMPVVQIEDGMPLEQNRVHVIAPNLTLAIKHGQLRLTPPSQPRGQRRPIDELFQSLAAAAGNRAVAVVMSGTGTNGSAGLAEIKANGGCILAQDPMTALFTGMPGSAIHTGLVDHVLAPDALAETIVEYVQSAYVTREREEEIAEGHFQQILALLRRHSHVELHSYRRPTIARRINRRMGLRGTRQLEHYVKLLREDAQERDSLINDLMINVTGFFRDPAAWDALAEHVVAPLVRSKKPGEQIRCWVTACSSGEEAYSLAILLTEHAEEADADVDIKVFATDLSNDAITRARAGWFAGGITTQLSPERLARFFVQEDHHYRIRKDVREKVIFAPHNLLADPPFAHLDIATCRNVLIYLEPEVQRKVLGILHFALQPNGALMLGSSESADRDSGLFQSLDPKHRIFRRLGPTRHDMVHFPLSRGVPPLTAGGIARSPGQDDLGSVALKAVADLTASAALLDARQRVVYFHGNTDVYLTHPHGRANLDVYSMARTGLEAPIRSAVTQARQHNEPASAEATIMRNGGPVRVGVTATPLKKDDFVLLSFRESAAPTERRAQATTDRDKTKSVLEEELRLSHADLAHSIEDLERTNEDLTASNEEVMSINEELQSTNEELETSKEELQSLNEELGTVNSQLQTKVDELERVGNNLANLLNSSDIATLFLSRDMRVKWFTPAIGRLFNLINTDIGRPIGDLAQRFVGAGVTDDCEQVLKTLVPMRAELQGSDGQWYLRQTTPFRTSDDKIDGVVLSFIDITDTKLAERKARRAAAKARKAAAAKDDFLARLSHELRTPLQPALLGLSGLNGRTDLPQEVTERLANITRNIEIEIRLIDDLLDLTRVGRGQLHLRRERIDALDLVNETVRLCRADSARKRQKMVVEGSSGECMVDVDRIRLQQVIWNLLRNAIRFTPDEGVITASCECMGDQVMLVVSDTGSGIPKEQLPRIFTSFERNDETFSGLGLGLSIAKSLVEAHDGRIEAESEGPGKGARFRVWLPRASSHAGSQTPDTEESPDREDGIHSPGNADLAGLRILLIEDHVDSANTMAALLQAKGCTTEIAGTLKDAVSAVQRHRFDLIVSDLALPDGTGYELIRKLPDSVPAVALSGLGSPQDRQRSVNAGFVEHLVKPVTISALSSAILRAVNST